MARRRKAGRDKADVGNPAKPAVQATTSLGSLLEAAGHAKLPPKAPPSSRPAGPQTRVPLPPPGPSTQPLHVRAGESPATELRMLNDAYEGARPIKSKVGRPPPREPISRQTWLETDRAEEAAARARLAALVGGGVRFRIVRQDEFVRGHRSDASAKLEARVAGKAFAPEATLDLHGQRIAQVADLVANFVRGQQRRGARNLLIIAGKGLHSEGGVGVLRDAAVEALTQGLAAPLVLAFSSAHESRGGSGALAILLG